jgi:hypothetical protein
MAKNVTLAVKGHTLTIKIDLRESGTPSNSGKSEVIASTQGNIPVPEHDDLRLGVNVYRMVR